MSGSAFGGTSEGLNEAVEFIRKQNADIAKLPAPTAEDYARFQTNTRMLADIENNRANILLAAIAGKKGLNNLPAEQMGRVVAALTGATGAEPPATAETLSAKPPARGKRK